jgi:hypothetical protein
MPSGITGTHTIKPSDDLYVRLSRDVYNGIKRFGQVYKVTASDSTEKRSNAERRASRREKKRLKQSS